MSKPIIDQAEVAIDFPDKFYHGSFGRGSRFDVKAENDGIAISLDRGGSEKRHVEFHIHYYMLEDLIASMAEIFTSNKDMPENHRVALRAASKKLFDSLR